MRQEHPLRSMRSEEGRTPLPCQGCNEQADGAGVAYEAKEVRRSLVCFLRDRFLTTHRQAEIAADNERELLLHNARSVVDKAARGDTEALGQLTRIFAKADADVSYVGSANVHSFLAVSGAGSVPPTPGGANPPLTSDAPDILSQFPARGVVDHLIDIFTASGPLDHFPFAPIALQRAYLNFAKVLDMRNQVADGIYLLHDSASLSPVSHAFICLVAMSCVLALQALPSDAITFVEVYGDLLEMRRHFYALARAALTRSDIEETPDMTRIEAIVMMGLVRSLGISSLRLS